MGDDNREVKTGQQINPNRFAKPEIRTVYSEGDGEGDRLQLRLSSVSEQDQQTVQIRRTGQRRIRARPLRLPGPGRENASVQLQFTPGTRIPVAESRDPGRTERRRRHISHDRREEPVTEDHLHVTRFPSSFPLSTLQNPPTRLSFNHSKYGTRHGLSPTSRSRNGWKE